MLTAWYVWIISLYHAAQRLSCRLLQDNTSFPIVFTAAIRRVPYHPKHFPSVQEPKSQSRNVSHTIVSAAKILEPHHFSERRDKATNFSRQLLRCCSDWRVERSVTKYHSCESYGLQVPCKKVARWRWKNKIQLNRQVQRTKYFLTISLSINFSKTYSQSTTNKMWRFSVYLFL